MENAIAGSDARGALTGPGQSTVPWAVAWFTWPMMFITNIGVAVHAIARHWDYSSVLTALLLANVAVLIALESLYPVERKWKMTGRSFLRDLKYFAVSGVTIAATNGVFGLASIQLNAGHSGPITDWPLWLSVPAALLVVDFFNYWQHRWSHEADNGFKRFLWRTHAPHHLPEQVYVLMHPAGHPCTHPAPGGDGRTGRRRRRTRRRLARVGRVPRALRPRPRRPQRPRAPLTSAPPTAAPAQTPGAHEETGT